MCQTPDESHDLVYIYIYIEVMIISIIRYLFILWLSSTIVWWMRTNTCDIDSSAQDCSYSIANALELLQSCTKLSIFNIFRYQTIEHNKVHLLTCIITKMVWNIHNTSYDKTLFLIGVIFSMANFPCRYWVGARFNMWCAFTFVSRRSHWHE